MVLGGLVLKKALIVGLNEYPGRELNWCDNDAIAMASLVETNGDGSPNYDTRLILDQCTRSRLQTAIRELFAADAEVALLYFSGHGAAQDGGYLVTTDYSQSELGVRMQDILKWANESRCRNRVIILDSCFSGQMGQSLLVNDCSVLGEGVTIMAASRAWEPSMENEAIEHGVFTNLLLQGLRGGAADISGNITPASLYSFVDQSLGAWDQRPVFKTNITQFLPIRVVSPRVPKELLRRICKYFVNPTDEYRLDPSYEPTNDPSIAHQVLEPYADERHVAILEELQLLESVGLVEPVGAEHMYFAAMEGKACKLTALGAHYWRLSKQKRI